MRSRFRMLSGEETIAASVRCPSVVGPRSTSLTRSDAAATASKYFSMSLADASFPSLPARNPSCVSGAGTLASKRARKTARASTRHHNPLLLGRLCVDVLRLELLQQRFESGLLRIE